MSLSQELLDLTGVVSYSVSQVESQEICLKKYRFRNTKLKLKYHELEARLRFFLTHIEDNNKLKSNLLEIRKKSLAKSKNSTEAGYNLKALYENIDVSKSILASKEEELKTLSFNLERLRRWNVILKNQKEELLMKMSSLSTGDLENNYSERVTKAKDLEVKHTNYENKVKELEETINEVLNKSKSNHLLDFLIPQKIVNIPVRLYDESSNLPGKACMRDEFKSLSSLKHLTAKPFQRLQQTLVSSEMPLHNVGESEEEIFIVGPPCQPLSNASERNKFWKSERLQHVPCRDSINSNDDNSQIEGVENLCDELCNMPADVEFAKYMNNECTSTEVDLIDNYDDDDDDLINNYDDDNDIDRCILKNIKEDEKHLVATYTNTTDNYWNDVTDGQFQKLRKKSSVEEKLSEQTSPLRLAVPVRRHVSLGDLSDEAVINLKPKRWSHQMELLAGYNCFVKPIHGNGCLKGNLRKRHSSKTSSNKKVTFDPIAMLFNAAVEGELSVVRDAIYKIGNINASNADGMTALHYAIFAEHFHVVAFLVEEGCDVNSPDVDGWTPLHCAASCNDIRICEFLIENGAAVFAASFDDQELPSDKCDEMEEGFQKTKEYLLKVEEDMGRTSSGVVYAIYDYNAESQDELSFHVGDGLIILRKGDDEEGDWWWGCLEDKEGYIPRNLIGLYPRVLSH